MIIIDCIWSICFGFSTGLGPQRLERGAERIFFGGPQSDVLFAIIRGSLVMGRYVNIDIACTIRLN